MEGKRWEVVGGGKRKERGGREGEGEGEARGRGMGEGRWEGKRGKRSERG